MVAEVEGDPDHGRSLQAVSVDALSATMAMGTSW